MAEPIGSENKISTLLQGLSVPAASPSVATSPDVSGASTPVSVTDFQNAIAPSTAVARAGRDDDVSSAIGKGNYGNAAGAYGYDERSIDFEGITRQGYDGNDMLRPLLKTAQKNAQDGLMFGRVLRADETVDYLKHRPGLELYFDKGKPIAEVQPLLDKLDALGFQQFTFAVDPVRTPDAIAGKMGNTVGLRYVFTPEFALREPNTEYGGDPSWSPKNLTDDQIRTRMEARSDELHKLAIQLRDVKGVSYAEQLNYEADVYFWGDYDDALRNAGTGAPNSGSGARWQGQQIRAGLERADRRREVSAGADSDFKSARDLLRGNEESARGLTGFPKLSPARSDGAGSDSLRTAGPRVSYGRQQAGSPQVEGLHFSQEKRTTLDSTRYGQGLTGAEAQRLGRESATPEQKQRIHFYVNEGTGVQAEAGVGYHAHAVKLNNLYDWKADQLDLFGEAAGKFSNYEDQVNYVEQQALAKGFDGIYARGAQGDQGVAVLLGKHSVPVDYLGMGKQTTEVAPPMAPKSDAAVEFGQQQQSVMANKSLPGGEMDGASWKRMMPKLMPEIDVSHLDDSAKYYRDQLVKRPAKKSPARLALEWKEQTSNDVGPVYRGDGFQLKAVRKFDTATDFTENGLPWGHNVQVQGEAYRFAIRKDNGAVVGFLDAEVNGLDEISAIHDMKIDKPGQGLGAKVVETIMASTYDGVRVIDVLPQSERFWDRLGAGYLDINKNTRLDFGGSPAEARGRNARGQAGRAQGAAGQEAARFSPSRAQVESPEFKKWFGDWQDPKAFSSRYPKDKTPVSQAVGDDGAPLRLYHATNGDFNVFETGRKSITSTTFGEFETNRHAIFTTPEVMFAESYLKKSGGQNVMPVYMDLKSPMDLRNNGAWDYVDDLHENGFASIRWPNLSDTDMWQMFDDETGVEFVKAAKKAGYDGAIMYEVSDEDKMVPVYVAFSPNQIKSAIGNNGQFDGTNPDIRLSPKRANLGDLTAAQELAANNVLGTPKTHLQRLQGFTKDWRKSMIQGVFDQFAPIAQLDPKAYILARLSKGGDSTLEALMLYGKVFVGRDGATDVRYTKAGGQQGFATKMAALKGEHDRFLTWVAAQRADRLSAIGLENLWSPTDITSLKTLSQGNMKDGTPRAMLYAQALKDLNEYNDNVLEVAEASGLIDSATRQLYKDTPYVPFYRLQEEGDVSGFGVKAGMVNQYAWKKLKGGTDKLNDDLLANLLHNWSHLITASAKNRAAKATLDSAVNAGIATQIPAGAPGKGHVSYKTAGKDQVFIVSDPHLMDAVAALEYAGLGPWAKPFSAAKHWLTIGVTANPAFKLRNLIRDSIQSVSSADISYNAFANVKQGWAATAEDSETRAHMLASGGMIRFGAMLDGKSSQRAKDLIHQGVDPDMILDSDNKLQSFWKKFVHPALEVYQELGDRTEQVNRAALYEQLIAKGLTHAEAAYWARDLMDFSMSGKWTAIRTLTQVVPFMNARLQGLYKLGRAGKQDYKRLSIVLGAVALSSLGLLLAYGDDDDWKKRSDADRNNYWWFKVGGHAFRLPKPFEIGAVGTMAERGYELMFDKEMTGKRFGANMRDIVMSQLSMNPVPQLVKPMMDIYANKDSFTGQDIESMGMEKLRKQDRYDEKTSELARFLGGLGLPDPTQLAMGRWDTLSPKQMDFMARAYFSWLGTATTTALDYGIRPMLDRGERPDRQLKDVFFAGNFVESLPANSSRYLSQLYDQAHEIEQAYASYHHRLKLGDVAGAQEILADERPNIARYASTETMKRAEAMMNIQLQKITASTTLTGAEKRERIDVIQNRRNQMAERFRAN